jgi:hypothetical protein
MSLSLQKAALGTPIMSKQLGCVTATNFVYQQNQVDTFMSTVTSGHYLSISMRIKAKNTNAEQKYGYEDLEKNFQAFNVAFTTSYQVTAAALAVLIQAAYPLLSVSESGGLITISTDDNYGLVIEYEYSKYLTQTSITRAFDLTTYLGDVILTATVSGADVRWSGVPVAGVTPTSAVGELVVDGNPFDVAGAFAIMNTKFIESGGTAVVDYDIFI